MASSLAATGAVTSSGARPGGRSSPGSGPGRSGMVWEVRSGRMAGALRLGVGLDPAEQLGAAPPQAAVGQLDDRREPPARAAPRVQRARRDAAEGGGLVVGEV